MKKKGCSFYMVKYSIEFKKEVVERYKKYGAAKTILWMRFIFKM
jgi:hypothetical protein